MNHSQLKSFLVFVEIDAEIAELESDKILVGNSLIKAEQLVKDYQSQISKNNLQISTINKKQHFLELELKAINAKEEDKKLKLERISNSKEFYALQQELNDIVKKKTKIEEDYLNVWQELEALETKVLENNKNLELDIARELNEIKNFNRRMASIENQLRDALIQKNEVIKTVDPELINQYISMKQSTKNPVVKVKRESCSGCFYMLSSQDLGSLEQYKLTRCKNCYRFVYNPEEPSEKPL